MNLDEYTIAAEDDFTLFGFISKGRRKIEKVIQFQQVDGDLYNLALGDKHPVTGKLDDLVVSNNGDSEKVLATVVGALRVFFEHHPEALVYAAGSTPARTRLYRMGITRYHEEARQEFVLYGLVSDDLRPFEPDTAYEGFLVRRQPAYL